jgi:hypothetical protein
MHSHANGSCIARDRVLRLRYSQHAYLVLRLRRRQKQCNTGICVNDFGTHICRLVVSLVWSESRRCDVDKPPRPNPGLRSSPGEVWTVFSHSVDRALAVTKVAASALGSFALQKREVPCFL